MTSDRVDYQKLEEAKAKLRDASFNPPPVNVCCHLAGGKVELGDVRYVATQIFDDSYHLFWCCSQCAVEYKVPSPGVFVVDDEGDDEESVNMFVTSEPSDEDHNPYEELLEKNKDTVLSRSFFEEKYMVINHEEILDSFHKIPFGKVIIKLL